MGELTGRRIWTVGHSTRSLEDFLELLRRHSIQQLADVRRFPGSRRHPQFGRESLEQALKQAGVAYRHFESLGGRRSARLPNSPNTAWRVGAFGAYADYMQSESFQIGLDELERWAGSAATTVMCAEAMPWRCHRRLIADVLIRRGWSVHDILDRRQVRPHALPEFALPWGAVVIYPDPQKRLPGMTSDE